MLQTCENGNGFGCGKVAVYEIEVYVPEFELDGRTHPERVVGTTQACAYCADGVEPGENAPLAAKVRKDKIHG